MGVSVYFYFLSPLRIFDYAYFTEFDLDGMQKAVQWVGLVIGVLVSAALPSFWSKLDAVEHEFDREASITSSLYYSLLSISNIQKKRTLLRGLRAYIKHVREHYAVEHIDLLSQRKGNEILYKLKQDLGGLSLGKLNDALSEELYRLTSEVVISRQSRISLTKRRIPGWILYLWILFQSISLIPLLGRSFNTYYAGVIVVGFVGFILTFVFLYFLDIDNAESQLDPRLWDELLEITK